MVEAPEKQNIVQKHLLIATMDVVRTVAWLVDKVKAKSNIQADYNLQTNNVGTFHPGGEDVVVTGPIPRYTWKRRTQSVTYLPSPPSPKQEDFVVLHNADLTADQKCQ